MIVRGTRVLRNEGADHRRDRDRTKGDDRKGPGDPVTVDYPKATMIRKQTGRKTRQHHHGSEAIERLAVESRDAEGVRLSPLLLSNIRTDTGADHAIHHLFEPGPHRKDPPGTASRRRLHPDLDPEGRQLQHRALVK